MKEANVICNQLGFNGARRVRIGYYGEGVGGIVSFRNRGCDGGEADILDCDLQSISTSNSNCHHGQDVGIECLGVYLFGTYVRTYHCDRENIFSPIASI